MRSLSFILNREKKLENKKKKCVPTIFLWSPSHNNFFSRADENDEITCVNRKIEEKQNREPNQTKPTTTFICQRLNSIQL